MNTKNPDAGRLGALGSFVLTFFACFLMTFGSDLRFVLFLHASQYTSKSKPTLKVDAKLARGKKTNKR